MARCEDCGGHTNTKYDRYNAYLCNDCYEKRQQVKLKEAFEKQVKKPADLKNWSARDLSELFWTGLSEYLKLPTRKALDQMSMSYRWACHDNKGLANSFDHALKWAKINPYEESRKWDRVKRLETFEGECGFAYLINPFANGGHGCRQQCVYGDNFCTTDTCPYAVKNTKLGVNEDEIEIMENFQAQKDMLLEMLWLRFDTPIDPETETIEESFAGFQAGTPREEIWHWFDENHSRGVAFLMQYEKETKKS